MGPIIARGWVALLGVAVLAGGVWAVADAQGPPTSGTGAAGAARAQMQGLEVQLQANESAVLASANKQGTEEIAALTAAKAQLNTLRQQVAAETAAAASAQQQAETFRNAALQATARAQQLAAALQSASAAPSRGGDDGGRDD